MSATRKYGEKLADDAYETPTWPVRRLLEKLPLPGGLWLEPCAATGQIVRGTARDDVNWTLLEKRAECLHALTALSKNLSTAPRICNYLDTPIRTKHKVLLTNPPFKLALEFAKKGIQEAYIMVLLLRLSWLASAKRAPWLRANTPEGLYVLPNRPSFTLDGRTDAADYAWVTWGIGDGIVILDETPIAERRAG